MEFVTLQKLSLKVKTVLKTILSLTTEKPTVELI